MVANSTKYRDLRKIMPMCIMNLLPVPLLGTENYFQSKHQATSRDNNTNAKKKCAGCAF